MNIGTCGCGTIASWISDFLDQLNDERIVRFGVFSPMPGEGQAFAQKYGWQKSYDTYEAMLSDGHIDLVYVCVPNHLHFDCVMQALRAGKNVVCEKPFAVNDSQAAKMLAMAEKMGVFISEALWPAFLPSRKIIDDAIAAGKIGRVVGGEIVSLTNVMFMDRIKKLETGGGALLDMGPYVLGRVTDHFGLDIVKVEGTFEHLESGVDSRDNYTLTFANGCTVHCVNTIDIPHEERQEYGIIKGTEGSIRMDSISNPQKIFVLDLAGNVKEELPVPPMLHGREVPFTAGYEYEFQAFEKALREGKKECEEAPHAQTLTIAHVMTELRRQANVIYPFE